MQVDGARAAPWRLALTFVVAVAGGGAASLVAIPLPWVLGAMLAVGGAMLAGVGARQPMPLRRSAQVCIGVALGLTFTQDVVGQLPLLGPALLAAVAFAVVLTILFARPMQRLAHVDGATAIYSVTVGASAEMSLQAQKAGADGARVAAAHVVRISLVVGAASFVALWSGERGDAIFASSVRVLDLPTTLLLALVAPACGFLATRIHVPNGWLLGPVLMSGTLAAFGLGARLHPYLLVAAQVVVGWGLGQHMTRAFFVKSPRMLVAATFVTAGMLALCMGVALALRHAFGVSMLTAFLSLAPGGTAEMAIVAKNFGVGVPIVTTFHIFRVVTMIVVAPALVCLLLRSGWVKADEAH